MPFTLLSTEALRTVTVGEQQTSRKGQKFSEIKFAGEQPCFQLSTEALFSPFKCGVYQGDGTETRLNLDLHISETLRPILEAYDEFFAKEIKKLAPKANYHPLVQESDGGQYPAKLRLKVNSQGQMAARIWRPDQTLAGNIKAVNTAGSRLIAIIVFTKIWYMGSIAGVTAELRHAVLYEATDIPDEVFPL